MTSPSAIAHQLAQAAADAWAEIRDDVGRHDKLGIGAGGNYTSRADKHLEDAIVAVAHRHGVAVLSEEAGFVGKGELLAVVDPLDGSRNAGRGIPFHCTSVAVGYAGAKGRLANLQAGVVRNLVTGQVYSAERGRGARLDGKAVSRRAFDPSEVLVGLIADYTTTEIDDAHKKREHHIRDLGSAALEICLVGTGALDAFHVRRPWLRVIDIAAACLFVREAGGLVIDPATGGDLDMPLDLKVRSGVVAAHNEAALQAVMARPPPSESGRVDVRPEPRKRLAWAIVGKASIPHVRKEAAWIRDQLLALGQTVHLETDLAQALGQPAHSLEALGPLVDIFLTVGGDGTMLMTMGATEKPVFGVNAGAIGFLAEVDPPQAIAGIEQILRGDYRVEERDRLAAWIDGVPLPDATNEVTLQTSRIAKLIQFRITVDGEILDTIRGDGVIVSTATGSTGYAMSVGGPLVHPLVHGTVLAPIAPFRLAARPWVVPSTATVELTVLDRDSTGHGGEPTARVVVDGQHGMPMGAGSTLRIAPSPRKARFVRLGPGFYERVRAKLTR